MTKPRTRKLCSASAREEVGVAADSTQRQMGLADCVYAVQCSAMQDKAGQGFASWQAHTVTHTHSLLLMCPTVSPFTLYCVNLLGQVLQLCIQLAPIVHSLHPMLVIAALFWLSCAQTDDWPLYVRIKTHLSADSHCAEALWQAHSLIPMAHPYIH